jgi:signal transduction histidine kinase
LIASREALRRRTIDLQRINAELEQASQAKDRFLATMSHELRTPLNAILGFTGTLLMKLPGPLTPDQEKQLNIVQNSGKHLLSLINELLDLARIESGKIELNPETIVCQRELNEVASVLRPLAEKKGLQLGCELPDADILVISDRRALFQIVMNLTNNAIKYTRSGTVTIGLRQYRADKGALTEISVADTGIGIDEADQQKLFDAFSRVGEGSERHESTGLGLYYSSKLADLIGGRITCTSALGKGSTFVLTIEPTPR